MSRCCIVFVVVFIFVFISVFVLYCIASYCIMLCLDDMGVGGYKPGGGHHNSNRTSTMGSNAGKDKITATDSLCNQYLQHAFETKIKLKHEYKLFLKNCL